MPTRFTIGKKLATEAQPGDELSTYSRTQLRRMDENFCAAVERAIRLGLERRQQPSLAQPLGNVPFHTLAARRTAQRYLDRVARVGLDELRGD